MKFIKNVGEHGGGSLRMSFQSINVDNPNWKDNTFVVRIFEAKDSHVNNKHALERFKLQIKEFHDSKW